MSRYSQLYLERGKPQNDSERFRRRLAAYMGKFSHSNAWSGARAAAAQKIRERLGIKVGHGYGDVENVFLKEEMRDVLDVITVIHINQDIYFGQNWLGFVVVVMNEENMAYRVDDRGIVHPFIDVEFEANRAAALEVLASTQFGEARTDFESAFRYLRNAEGKSAIRSMFPAVEVAAKVLFPGVLSRLMPNDLDRLLKPKIQTRYAGNEPAIDAALQLLEGFKKWINASQPYRHGQEVQEPVEPPQDFLIAHMSTGAAYLRWMIELAG